MTRSGSAFAARPGFGVARDPRDPEGGLPRRVPETFETRDDNGERAARARVFVAAAADSPARDALPPRPPPESGDSAGA